MCDEHIANNMLPLLSLWCDYSTQEGLFVSVIMILYCYCYHDSLTGTSYTVTATTTKDWVDSFNPQSCIQNHANSLVSFLYPFFLCIWLCHPAGAYSVSAQTLLTQWVIRQSSSTVTLLVVRDFTVPQLDWHGRNGPTDLETWHCLASKRDEAHELHPYKYMHTPDNNSNCVATATNMLTMWGRSRSTHSSSIQIFIML